MTSLAWVFALVFLEPLALVGLVAPLVLLALGLRRQAGRELYLGTTRFFGDTASGEEDRPRRSLPLWLLCAAASVLLGVLALAGPGFEGPPIKGVVLDLVVDRSPSMYLPHASASGSGERRIDRAWGAFQLWAEDYEADHPGGVFVSTGASDPVPWRAFSLPLAPETAADEVLWAAYDASDAVWITDAAGAADGREFAGLFASGGAAVPGVVSLGATGGIYWNSDGTTEFRPGLASSGKVYVEPGVPSDVVGLARLWAEARGLRVQDDPDNTSPVPELVLKGRAGGDESVRAGRDGWEADLILSDHGPSGLPVAAGWSPWLLGPRGEALVAMAPGRVALGFHGFSGEPTDRAAFAVSWIGLFDRARLTPNEVVEVVERQAAGSAVSIPPARPRVLESPGASARREQQEERGAALRAVLAAAAALVGLVALVALLRRG